MSTAKNRFYKLIGALDAQLYIGGLGILIVVIILWSPFGLKIPDYAEGWGNLSVVQGFHVMKSDFTTSRPLVYFPWKVAYLLSRDSFIGARLVLAALFWGKAFALYAILRKMRLANAVLAFLIAILFILHPADQGNLILRALGRHFAVFLYVVSVLFMVLACQRSNPLYLIGMLIAEGASALASEQGLPLILFTPLVLLLCKECSKSKKVKITLWWFGVLALSIFNFITADKQHQAAAFDGSRTGISQFIQEVLLSNLIAYRRLFFDGWQTALKWALDFQTPYFYFAIAITLATGLTAWLLSRLAGEQEKQVNIGRYFAVLILAGLAIIGLSFFPYSITTARYDGLRVFYYAAAGAALVTGIIFFKICQAIPRFGKTIEFILWGVTVFLIASNGLNQYAKYAQRGLIQQQILVNIVEQAPYVSPNTTLVLLVSEESAKPFGMQIFFQYALNWIYDNLPPSESIICYENRDNCVFDIKGIAGSISTGAEIRVLYENVLLFRYATDKGTVLLDQIPPEYQREGVTYNYRPYRRIAAFTPFPRRPQKAFDFLPDPARLSPEAWTGATQSLNDRKVCDVSSSGRCSLLLYGDETTAAFGQTIPVSGSAGEQFKLTLWHKTQDVSIGIIPALVTVFYSDGSTGEFISSAQPSSDWTTTDLAFQPAKPYTHLLVTLLSNAPSGLVWLDNLLLTKDNIEVNILNPSFEK